MNLKDGVVFDERMHPSMWYAREVIGSLHREWADQEGTITSSKEANSQIDPEEY